MCVIGLLFTYVFSYYSPYSGPNHLLCFHLRLCNSFCNVFYINHVIQNQYLSIIIYYLLLLPETKDTLWYII